MLVTLAPWAVVRAAQGLLLTTSSRAAQGASVASTQMDAAEAVAQLRAARQLGEALSQSARQQGAHGLSSHDGDQAWQHHAEQIDPQAQGRYEGSVGGQQAKKAQGRTLTDPVERFAKPLLHLDTPVSASFVTPTSIHLFSGRDTSLSAQGDLHSTSAHSFSAVSGQTTSLYTHSGGIKAITANAGLSLRAHTDAQQIWSEKDLTVQSTTDEIRVQASKSITLTAGQSQIVIEGGNITFTCPGTWTVKGASHDWSGGGSEAASFKPLPSGLQQGLATTASPMETFHGYTVSVEEVPEDWLPSPLGKLMAVECNGEVVSQLAVPSQSMYSDEVLLSKASNTRLWVGATSQWQASEDVMQPEDDDLMVQEEYGDES